MADLEQQCKSTCAIIAETTIDNTHWKAFGYRNRPKRGKLFNRFVSPEKLKYETVLLQEFWAASFARIFYWALLRNHFQFRIEFVARLMEICIDGLEQPLWPILKFKAIDDAVNYLTSSCSMYGKHDLSEHDQVFVERCTMQLKQEIPPAWLHGAAWFFSHPDSLITTIITALDKSGVAKNNESNLLIRNQSYVKIFNELFKSLTH